MKIVMSFWSFPCKGGGNNYRLNGGWINQKAHWLSWILSVNLAINYR